MMAHKSYEGINDPGLQLLQRFARSEEYEGSILGAAFQANFLLTLSAIVLTEETCLFSSKSDTLDHQGPICTRMQ